KAVFHPEPVREPVMLTRPAHWLGVKNRLSRQNGTGVYRYVKIAEGCSNRCSYCTIPAIRGAFSPIDAAGVIDSVNTVVGQGAREVGLVAQDSGAHPELTGIIDRVTGLHPGVWFRLYYIHPAHFPSDLPMLFESRPNLTPYLDLPIQHASAPVLERMGRGYGPDRLSMIMDTIEGLSRPVAVRFTVITGYPGETDKDFISLERFLGKYSSLRHIAAFPWWPEEGTPEYERAARQGDSVPDHVTMERLSALSSMGESIYHSWAERLSGERFPVMADTSLTGHSLYDAPDADLQTTFTRPVVPGSVVMCSLVSGSSSEMVVDKAD
ncbi:MAG: radical SAM protein, partial [Candidatus Fermentibacteraceae bacterium]